MFNLFKKEENLNREHSNPSNLSDIYVEEGSELPCVILKHLIT